MKFPKSQNTKSLGYQTQRTAYVFIQNSNHNKILWMNFTSQKQYLYGENINFTKGIFKKYCVLG